MSCEHAEWERSDAHADGLCPLCLKAENERLTAERDALQDSYEGEIENRLSVSRSHEKYVTENERLRAALEDTRKKYRWLKSKARVKSRDFEEPQYAWSIHWRSTCATVENAIKQALQGDSDE